MKTRTFLKAMALACGATAAPRSFAQSSPARPIRLVVPLPAGSGVDFVARVVSAQMSQILGQTIVVDNKPGANGVIAALEVVRAAPDGLTLMCATNSHLATNMALVKNLPYDPRKDLTAIGSAVAVAQMLVVSAASPIKSFAEFIAEAKRRPGKLSVGHATSIVQLQFAALSKVAGIDLLMVPYKGAPATVNDMIGGTLDAALENPGLALPLVQAGKVRVLASMSKRSVLFPEVPSASETLPGFDFPLWNAFVGPAGMARDQVERLSAALAQALRHPEVAGKLNGAGNPPWISTPDEMKAVIEREIPKYLQLAKDAGIEPQ
jgi:tripartite-type tricarboxylate transporter receptor subunit TctC